MRARPLNVATVLCTAAVIGMAACGGGDLDGAHDELRPALERARSKYPQNAKRKIVLLGMDSCDPDLVRKYIQQGKLPHFARLVREGASGDLGSLSPLLSPVVWTTVATGMPPERHGILDFVTDTPEGPRPVSSKMRQADPIWQLVSRAGDTAGVVGWLVTWPAEPLNGYMVTERMGLLAYEGGRREGQATPHRTHPENLAADLERLRITVDDMQLSAVRPFADVTDEEYGLAYSPVITPTVGIPPEMRWRHLLANLRLTLATAETFRNIGTELLRKDRPRFFACYFEAMDALSHYFMRYAPPQLPEIPEKDFLRFRSAIEANYIWHDQVLGEFMELCDEDTTLVLVSDHGFKHGRYRMPELSDFHAKTGAMWHRRYGVFYAWGNGVARGAQVSGASVFDIAPTLLAAMGYPVPDDMPGRVLIDAFEGGLEYETVPTWFGEQRRMELVESGGEEEERTPEDEEELARLRAVGYLGGDRSDPASTMLNLGSRLRSTGRLQRAKEEFEKVLAAQEKLPPEKRSPQVLFSLAEVHLAIAERLRRFAESKQKRGESDEARADLERAAIELAHAERYNVLATAGAPDEVIGLWLRARVFIERGELGPAEEMARKSVNLKPHQPAGHTILAGILRRRMEERLRAGDAAGAERLRLEAIRSLELALDREPRQPFVLTELAHLRLAGEPDPEKNARDALESLDQAIALVPRSHTALNNRAIALLRLAIAASLEHRTDEKERLLAAALDSADRALEVHPKYPKGFANRAYVLWHMGRLDDAFASAMSAREIDPGYRFNGLFLRALDAHGKPIPTPE